MSYCDIFVRRRKQLRDQALARLASLPNDFPTDVEGKLVLEVWANVWREDSQSLHPDANRLVEARFKLAQMVLPKVSILKPLPRNLFDGLNELQELSVYRAMVYHQYSRLRESHLNKKTLRKKLAQLDQSIRTRLDLICDAMSAVYSSEVAIAYVLNL